MMSTHFSLRWTWGAGLLPVALVALASLGAGPSRAGARPARDSRAQWAPGRLPLHFEANRGQAEAPVRFLGRGGGGTLLLTPTEAVFSLSAAPRVAVSPRHPSLAPPAPPARTAAVRMRLLGADPAAKIEGLEPLPGRVNYFLGKDPKRWRRDVPTFGRVRSVGVYPGVDLVYYGSEEAAASRLEYDFQVAPGADPARIALRFDGAQGARIDPSGDLVLNTPAGDLRHHRPVAYQLIDGKRVPVPCEYRLGFGTTKDTKDTKDAKGRTGVQSPTLTPTSYSKSPTHPHTHTSTHPSVRLAVGAYDKTRPLTIDPTLTFGTYLGGGAEDLGCGVAIGGDGNVIVAGVTKSTNLSVTNGAFQNTNKGEHDVFVAKVTPDGSRLIYLTYLGGTKTEYTLFNRMGVAADGSGNAYVVGYTESTNFPTTANALDKTNDGFGDGFVTKLDATGSNLVYSTYLGGKSWDYPHAVGVTSDGSAVVVGSTGSDNFPTTTNAFQKTYNGGHVDAFITKINPQGTALTYSTYLGSPGKNAFDNGYAMALDANGRVYVTGQAGDAAFPVTANALQSTFGGASGDSDAYVAIIDPSLSGTASLVYSTFLGGSKGENDFTSGGIAVDAQGLVYVTGTTKSTNFPLKSPVQNALVGTWGCFVTKFDPGSKTLVYSTYLCAQLGAMGNGIAVDGGGNAIVTGNAFGDKFPLVAPIQQFGGSGDVFVSKLSPTGALLFSTYLGGSGDENGGFGGLGAVALDLSGNAFITGSTTTSNFNWIGALQPTYGGATDALLARFNIGSGNGGGLNAPSNLSAVATSSSRIELSWTDNSTTETAFKIERKSGGSGFAFLAQVPANTTIYPDAAVVANTLYTYRVYATTGTADSGFSNEASASPGGSNPTVPTAPTSLRLTGVTSSSASLAWTDTSNNETGFHIQRRLGNGSYTQVGTRGANVTSFQDTGLSGNTTYTYRVFAHNTAGDSAPSNELDVTTSQGPPAAPSHLAAVAKSGTQIDLTWQDNSDDETSFEIEIKAGEGGTWGSVRTTLANATSATLTDLRPGTLYFFRVRAVRDAEKSEPSQESSAFTRPAAPRPPSRLTARGLSRRISLSWQYNGGTVSAFVIERKVSGFDYEELKTVSGNARGFTDTRVSLGRTYVYRVRARNGGGTSAPSNAASARATR